MKRLSLHVSLLLVGLFVVNGQCLACTGGPCPETSARTEPEQTPEQTNVPPCHRQQSKQHVPASAPCPLALQSVTQGPDLEKGETAQFVPLHVVVADQPRIAAFLDGGLVIPGNAPPLHSPQLRSIAVLRI